MEAHALGGRLGENAGHERLTEFVEKMENRHDNSDALWDGMLKELGRRETLAADPTPKQTARWMRSISEVRKPAEHHSHPHRWGIWSTYAAAAAVLIVAVLMGTFVNHHNLTAEEVFVSVDQSVASSPVVMFSLHDLRVQRHLVDMDFMASNTDGSMYVNLNVRPASAQDKTNAICADISYISQNSKGMLLIKSLTCDGKNILQDMAPQGCGLALRFENVANDSVKSRFLPGRIEVSSIKELLDSLQTSASDFQIVKLDGNRAEISGVIDKPQNLSVGALMQSAMVANYANMLVMGIGTNASSATLTPKAKENFDAVGKILMGTQFGKLLDVMPKQLDRVFRFLAASQMYRSTDVENMSGFTRYREDFNKAVNAMRVIIIYDRTSGMIQRVTLKDTNDVSVNIRFASDDELQLKIDEVINQAEKADDFVKSI